MFFFLFAQARYYLPEIGRFISEDSYKGTMPDTQSQNRYIYCTNNPMKYIDPSGHIIWVPIAVGAAQGAAYVSYRYGPQISNAVTTYGPKIVDGASRGYNTVITYGPQAMNMIASQLDKIPAVFNIGNAATQAAEKGGGSNSGGGSNNFDPNDPRWKDAFGKDAKHFEEKWHKGSYNNSSESCVKHFIKHGKEVGAKDVNEYLRKAEGFKNNLKGATKSNVYGKTEGVVRYKKNGKYIDIAPDGRIISFGMQ